jgi:transposase
MKTLNRRYRTVMWHKVNELKGQKLSKSQISRQLDIDRATVRKYLMMDEASFYDWISKPRRLPKKLQQYYSFIKSKLEDFQGYSASQIEDLLKEKYDDLPLVNSKTVYNFVTMIRNECNIKKKSTPVRVYEKLPETEYGQQAQVDFGEFNMRGERSPKKVYFFTMVLSRSRQKFVHFRNHPFTTESTIESHNLAFEYFGGQPKEIWYDQDRVMMVNENLGDLVLTAQFAAYCKEMAFAKVFCRKSDPESKGKIENVVGYVKYNFLRGRKYNGIDNLNDQSLGWLKRTGNGKMHAGIRKIPHEEWLIERTFLLPFNYHARSTSTYKEYFVRKDNTISYHSNFYTLPLGTYKGNGTQILVKEENDRLLIFSTDHELITIHDISGDRGVTVRRTDHRRDKSDSIDNMKSQIAEILSYTSEANLYIQLLSKHKGRYLGDNLRVLVKKLPLYESKYLTQACLFCLENNVFNAFNFIEVVSHYQQQDNQLKNIKMPLIDKIEVSTVDFDYQPKVSEISIYENIM